MAIDVIIALKNEDIAQKIKIITTSNGFNVVTMCTYGNELIRSIKQFSPSIVISEYKFKDMNLIDIYESVGDECSFLVIVKEPYKSIIQEQTDIFCISSPINTSVLINSLDIIYQSERRVKKLKNKVSTLEIKINERIFIEKAKGIIMKRFLLSEEDSYKYIQKYCMDNGIKIIEFSKRIINEKESLF